MSSFSLIICLFISIYCSNIISFNFNFFNQSSKLYYVNAVNSENGDIYFEFWGEENNIRYYIGINNETEEPIKFNGSEIFSINANSNWNYHESIIINYNGNINILSMNSKNFDYINFNDSKITSKLTTELIGSHNGVPSYRNCLLKLENGNYLSSIILYSSLSHKTYITIFNLESNDINNFQRIKQSNKIYDYLNSTSCFQTESTYIQCSFLTVLPIDAFHVGIYDLNLNEKKTINFGYILDYTFTKIFHIKGEIGAYIFFDNRANNVPKLFLKKLNDNHNNLINLFSSVDYIVLNNNGKFNIDYGLFASDAVKIDDTKFIVIHTISDNSGDLLICLCDFNEDYTGIRVRYYRLYLSKNNIKISVNLRAFIFKDYFGIIFYDSNSEYPGYMIFDYPKIKNENKIENRNIKIQLSENSLPLNFSFSDYLLKYIAFSGEIKLQIMNYTSPELSGIIIKNSSTEFIIGDIFNFEEHIIFERNKNSILSQYFLDILSFVENDESSSYANYIENNSEEIPKFIFNFIFLIECQNFMYNKNEDEKYCLTSCIYEGTPLFQDETENICYSNCSEAINGNIYLYGNFCKSHCPDNYIPNENNLCILNTTIIETAEKITTITESSKKTNTIIESRTTTITESSAIANAILHSSERTSIFIGSSEKTNTIIESQEKTNIILESPEKTNIIIGSSEKANTIIGSSEKTNIILESSEKTNTIIGSSEKINTIIGSSEKINTIIESLENTNIIIESPEKTNTIIESPEKTNTIIKSSEKINTILGEPEKTNTIIESPEKKNSNIPSEESSQNIEIDNILTKSNYNNEMHESFSINTDLSKNNEDIINNCYINSESLINDYKMKGDIIEIKEFENCNYTYYCYSSNANMAALSIFNPNLIYIDFNECKNILINERLISTNSELLIIGKQQLNDSRKFLFKNFEYEIYDINGTKIEDLSKCQNTKLEISTPINDNIFFEEALSLSEQGYDIFNLSSSFYYDLCLSVSLNNSDLTLSIRQNDILQKNADVCLEGCTYNGVNLTDKRISCLCSLDYEQKNDTLNNKQIEEVDENFFSYILGMINYKIVICHKLLLNFKNYYFNYGFYTGIGILFLILIFCLIYFIQGKKSITIQYLHNISKMNVNKSSNIVEKMPKRQSQAIEINRNVNNKLSLSKINDKKSKTYIKDNIKDIILELNAPTRKKAKIHNNSKKSIYNKISINKNEVMKEISDNEISNEIVVTKHLNNNNNIKKKLKEINNNEKKNNDDIDYNELSYTQAIVKDERNIIQMFFTYFKSQIQIIQIVFFPKQFSHRSITFSLYLYELLLDLTFNALLFSDDVISQKYYNNGNLLFITSQILSISSNVISCFIVYITSYLVNYYAIFEAATFETRNPDIYLRIFIKISSFIYLKIIIFFILAFILGLFCSYYLFIFCAIFKKIQKNLFMNYLSGTLWSLLYKVGASLISSILRKISIYGKFKQLFFVSKYIDDLV